MFENLDDPRKQALLMAAAGLFAPVRGKGWSGFGEALSQGIQGGLLGLNRAQTMQAKLAEEKQQQQMRQLAMDRANQEQEAQRYFGAGLKQYLSPGVGAMPNTPVDDNGNPMPSPMPKFDQQGFAGYLAQNPATAAQALQFMPKPVDPKFEKLGNTLVQTNAEGGPKPVYSVPAEAKDWQNPEYIKAQMAIRAAGRPQVTVDTRQETEFSKKIGEMNAQEYVGLMKSGASAQSQSTKLARLEYLLGKSGQTGKFTPATKELKSAAESLGFKVDEKLPFQQAAEALSNEIALTLRNPAGGAGMPGALSDRDREFLQNMVPNLSKTPEGNKLIIESMKRLAKREQEVAALAREYRTKTGKFDDGFYAELAQKFGGKDLFGDISSKAAPSVGPYLSDIEAEILRRRKGQ